MKKRKKTYGEIFEKHRKLGRCISGAGLPTSKCCVFCFQVVSTGKEIRDKLLLQVPAPGLARFQKAGEKFASRVIDVKHRIVSHYTGEYATR